MREGKRRRKKNTHQSNFYFHMYDWFYRLNKFKRNKSKEALLNNLRNIEMKTLA